VIWKIVVTGPARRDLARLDRQSAARIVAAIRRLATTGYGDVKRLAGQTGELRLRVSGWRVRFVYDHANQAIEVRRVLPRGRAYRD
jgi:mRNA-degrading endonuclease RelE of RelBE toxin-antitoxin system